MKYSFLLLPHANIHYREALGKLGSAELRCILKAASVEAQIVPERLGGADFLTFDAPELTPSQLAAINRHSALMMLCRREGDALLPMERPSADYFPGDLAEILKYKGKTSAVFTRMMIDCALTASGYFAQEEPVTVLDPLCGRGTTAFCALQMGYDAVGVDVDRKDMKEATDYFTRYLQYHRFKHQASRSARTVRGVSVPEWTYTAADTKEHYQSGDTRTLRLLLADTAMTGELLRKTPVELIVADLPYGIQHAPQDGRQAEGFEALLRRSLPSWLSVLKPGGAMALSFNTLTLPRARLVKLAADAGFIPLIEPPYDDFSHFVEQAVNRDIVVAKKA